MEKKENNESYQNMLEKAKEINPEAKQKLEQSQTKIYSEKNIL